eukprot:TRINITY_DN5083_c0_g1_i3.p1 TRINITY_DN5083_c0_g1~~TRINITY_DN5083_c0_g1_i3.p1  ORF type:complete len:398 (+),score=72.00 TRINITY_DN5083_c0_g1_i3:98-1291(+)
MCIRDRYQRRVRGDPFWRDVVKHWFGCCPWGSMGYEGSRGRCLRRATYNALDVSCLPVIRPSFWKRPSFWGVACIWLVTLVGLHLSWSGVCMLPKCRYGEKDCYFQVRLCFAASNVTACRPEFRQRAIEGSGTHPVLGSEQLAIPLLAVLFSCIPPVVAAVTVMVKRNMWLLDAGKYMLGVTMCLLCVGVDVLQRKTFDCRWWNDTHHGNADACQRGLGLYVAGTLLIIMSEMALLLLFTRMYERELVELTQMQISCLTNSAMSAINLEQFEKAVVLCSKAISLDTSCVKAYFRRGVANAKMGNLILAIDDLQSALELQPRNDAVDFELRRCEGLLEGGADPGNGLQDVHQEFSDEGDEDAYIERPLLSAKKVRFADEREGVNPEDYDSERDSLLAG